MMPLLVAAIATTPGSHWARVASLNAVSSLIKDAERSSFVSSLRANAAPTLKNEWAVVNEHAASKKARRVGCVAFPQVPGKVCIGRLCLLMLMIFESTSGPLGSVVSNDCGSGVSRIEL